MEINKNTVKNEKGRKFKGVYTVYLRNCLVECPRIEAEITGKIPLWLKGSLIRNGPGSHQIGQYEYKHLFDFPSLLRKYSIENGKVFYENKFLKSSTFKKNQEKKRIVVTEFGTTRIPDPCKTLLQRFMSLFTVDELFTDNSVVSFTNVNDEIYASSDSPYLVEVDTDNLQTLETIDIRKYVSVNNLTSHAHKDDDGNVYNMGNSVGHYNILKIEPKTGLKHASIVAKVPIRRPLNPSYSHSFCMTENYFVFIEQPLVISVATFMSQILFGGPHSDLLKWKPKYKNRFYLISRKDGSIVNQKYISEPFAFFHTINAYEENNHVIVDVCCFKNANVLQAMFTNAIKETETDKNAASREAEYIASQARRFVLPILDVNDEAEVGINVNSLRYSKATSTVMKNKVIHCSSETLTLGSVEMPTINYSRCNGKRYRYFYCVGTRDNNLLQLLKCDTETKSSLTWFDDNCYPSEPIFVSSPNAVEEDDGVIISSIVSLIDQNKGFLLILDAKTFKEIGRASITAPSALPADFHGCFLSN